mgnify:CR=1 FL=1
MHGVYNFHTLTLLCGKTLTLTTVNCTINVCLILSSLLHTCTRTLVSGMWLPTMFFFSFARFRHNDTLQLPELSLIGSSLPEGPAY